MVTMSLAFAACAITFTLPAQDKQPQWKDREEYDTADAAFKDANATTRLQKLDKWKEKYPATEQIQLRQDFYVITYPELKQGRQTIAAAQDILKDRPNSFLALRGILVAVHSMLNPIEPADLDLLQRTAEYMKANEAAIYAPTNKPFNYDDKTWAALATQMKPVPLQTMTWIWGQRKGKDDARIEADTTKYLKEDGTQAAVSYLLAGALLGQNKTNPEKQVPALYHYARAAAYDGANSLPAATRQTVEKSLTNMYTQYHGSADGLKELLAMAKGSTFPPADFSIKSDSEMKIEAAAKKAEEDAKDPVMALWRNIKSELTGADGAKYFADGLKDKGLPTFKGKIVDSTVVKGSTKELKMGVEKIDVADVTLQFEEPLPGTMMNGEELQFTGTGESFTASPYMLVLKSDEEDVKGWTGKAPKGAAAKAAPAAKGPATAAPKPAAPKAAPAAPKAAPSATKK